MRANTPEVFWTRVDKSGGPDACWPYTGRRKPPGAGMEVGHGMYDHDNTWDYAHRYAWFLVYGEYPDGDLCHRCDFPPCCNPRHAYVGNDTTNAQDRERRGRRNVKGERHPGAKLNEDKVRAIRADPNIHRIIAEKYGVSTSTIDYIKKGKRWAHLT